MDRNDNATNACSQKAEIMPNWQLLQITWDGLRPLKDVMGNTLTIQPVQPGQTLLHWADPDLAMAWFNRANDLLNDSQRMRNLTKPPTFVDAAANVAAAQAQWTYVGEIMYAISSAYNALNINWYNDPTTRTIYRSMFPGLPFAQNGLTDDSIFGSDNDYRHDWYTASVDTPYINAGVGAGGDGQSGSSPFGSIVQKLIEGRINGYPLPGRSLLHPIDVVLTSMFQTTVPPGTVPRDNSVDASLSVMNSFMCRDRNPWSLNAPKYAAEPFAARYPDFPYDAGTINGAQLPNAYTVVSGVPVQMDDWRAYYFNIAQQVLGQEVTSEQLGAACGLFYYLPFFKNIVAGALARNASQIIQDSRGFVLYMNAGFIRKNGGLPSAIQNVLNTRLDIAHQQMQYQGVFNAIGSGAAALGAALATSTYGISALVGGAVAATASIAGAEYRAGYTGHGKDDLGRLKPIFERAWLSGDPSYSDPNQGAPEFPVENPPGYPPAGTSNQGIAGLNPVFQGLRSRNRQGVPVWDTVSNPEQRVTLINQGIDLSTIGTVAAIAAAGYVGYKVFTGK